MWRNGYGYHGMMGWDGGIWSWFMGFHGILWILFLVLIVFGLINLVRDWRRNPARDTALATLANEFASGRISREEYLSKKECLQKA